MSKRVLLCYLRIRKPSGVFWEYTGLFYLAAGLKRAGYDPFVYHGDWMGFKEKVRELEPDVIGYSCDAENQHFLEGLISAVKKEYLERTGKVPVIVVGGPQACALSDEFLRDSGTDYILRGEGDETLPQLLDSVFKKDRDEASLLEIPGLVWKNGEGVFCENAGIGMVEDLDTLPRPYYEASLHRQTYGKVIFSGRGCPFHCAFCASHVGHDRFRTRRIPDVLDEIRENLERSPGIGYIVIQDDTFCTDPVRVREFCRGMREIRRKVPIVWFCETHVKTLLHNPGLLREMIDSGLVRLQTGMESGDENVLKLYRKNITPGEVLELVSLACEEGLPQIAGNFIVGGPKEKEGVTEDFIRKLIRTGAGMVDINTGFLRNYPMTPISKDPAAFGLKVVAEDDRTAGDDFPGVIPADSTVDEVVAMRQGLNRAIREEMDRCIRERLIPTERAVTQLTLLEEYGIASRWTLEFSAREYVNEYFRMHYLKEAVPFDRGMSAEELYPERTFQYYRSVITTEGYPWLFGTVLSPLEADILFYSAGKKSISRIAADLWDKYRGGYKELKEFEEAVFDFIGKAEKRYWVTVFWFV